MNLERLSYKQKSHMLLWGGILLLLLVYLLAVRPTLAVFYANVALQEEMKQAEERRANIHELREKLNEINKLLVVSSHRDELHVLLFDKMSVSAEKNRVILSGLEQKYVELSTELTVETFEASFIGSYVSLVSLIYELERELHYGKIVSSQFHLEKNRKTKEEKLVLSLLMQCAVDAKK